MVKHHSLAELEGFAHTIVQSINQPIRIQDHEIYISPSIGISQYPQDDIDPDNLIRFADIAMEYAKELGGNQVQYFNSQIYAKIERRIKIEKHLRKALEKNEFILVYQPQVNLLENQIIGFESLIRWESPELGGVSPLEFIPIAEETGLIYPIGKWVLREACSQNKSWQELGFPKVSMAVNLSSKQFYDQSLKDQINSILQETGLETQYLELPAIVNTIIALARNLKLVVIAEGVENEDDLKILQEFNCDTVQGYLFSRPVEAIEVPEIFDRFACNRIANI